MPQGHQRLSRAEATLDPVARNQLISDGLKCLYGVPLTVNLGTIIPQLQRLHAMSGIVELVHKVANAHDPNNLAASGGIGPDIDAAKGARLACYQHFIDVLDFLVSPRVRSGEVQAEFSPEQRAKLRRELLATASMVREQLFHERLYEFLVLKG